jgi:hypothetical protein
MASEATEFSIKQTEHDDGRPWGHITLDGVWHELPKTPLLLADMGPPPFWVRLPSGEMREVLHKPELV